MTKTVHVGKAKIGKPAPKNAAEAKIQISSLIRKNAQAMRALA